MTSLSSSSASSILAFLAGLPGLEFLSSRPNPFNRPFPSPLPSPKPLVRAFPSTLETLPTFPTFPAACRWAFPMTFGKACVAATIESLGAGTPGGNASSPCWLLLWKKYYRGCFIRLMLVIGVERLSQCVPVGVEMIFTSESFSTMRTFEWFQTSMNELMLDTIASVCESTSANWKSEFWGLN